MNRSSHLDTAAKTALAQRFGDQVRLEEPMSRYTTWRVGGPAELLFQPQTEAALAEFLAQLAPSVPVHWIGLGSNLLVRDAGVAGVVVTSRKLPRTLKREGLRQVYTSSAVPCATLARALVRWGLGPSEFLAGIPGSFGGALTMNAGAHGSETWDAVQQVRLVTRGGELAIRDAASFDVGYRSVRGQEDAWFMGARLEFDNDYVPSLLRLRDLQARRKATQPIGQPSCGSVFANPDGDHAARLIESAGLKGTRIGGAEVSPKHANFIINTGDASADDIEALISHVAAVVANRSGVALRHEVRFLGGGA